MTSVTGEASAGPKAARRWRRWAIRAGVALLLYTLLGIFLVPWVIRRQVVGAARDRLHRSATLGRVRFNPFSLNATLSGLDLRDRDNTPLVAFDTLVVNLSLASLPKRALALDEIRLVRPVVAARIMSDGKPAIGDLFAGDTATAPHDTVTPPPRLVVRRASIRDGVVIFTDLSRDPAYQERFEDLGLSVDEFSTLPRQEGDHTLTVSFASGASLRWQGASTFQPMNLTGRVTVTGLSLKRASDVLGGHLPLVATQGAAGVRFAYQVTQASTGRLQFALSDGAITLDSLVIQPRDTAVDWFRLPRAEAHDVRLSYPARGIRVGSVLVTDPWLAAARLADGSLSWTPYLARLVPPTDSTAPPSEPWSAVVDSVMLSGGTLAVEDRTVTPALRQQLSAIAVRLAPVSTDSTQPIALALSARLGDSAAFSARGSAVRAPLRAELEVEASGLQLPMAQSYLGESAPVTIAGGTVSAQGKLRMQRERPEMVFDGRVDVDRAGITDSASDTLLAWRTMAVRDLHYTRAPDLLRIRTVRVGQPFARIAISPAREVNLSVLSRLGSDSGAAADTAAAMRWEIQEILMERGRLDFTDLSLILPFRALIDSTGIAIRDVASFGGTPGSLELAGRIEPTGSASAKGTLHLADPFAATDISARFRNVDMTQLTPYSATFAGYTIREGRLDVDIDYRIHDRQLDANHRIVADNLQLGEKVEGGGTPGFLVKLAVSLMKDREGKIKLDAPMTGAVDDPDFHYTDMVWQVMKQVLGKVASAPFRFLGKLLGIGGDDPDLVGFEPGRTALLPPEREALDSIAAELGRRPELVLQVAGRYDSVADPAAIREAGLAARIAARRDSLGAKAAVDDTSATALGRILESLYAEQFSPAALDTLRAGFTTIDSTGKKPQSVLDAPKFYAEARARLLAAEPLEAGLLERLARDRAAAIVAALTATGALDPARVTLGEVGPMNRKKGSTSLVASELRMDAP